MNKITCDKCKHEEHMKPRTERLRDEVKRIYIKCPKCEAEYTCYYTNKEIERLQKRQRKLSTRRNERSYNEFIENKNKIGNIMGNLRKQME